MRASANRGVPRHDAVVIGIITFLISLGLTAALLALDLNRLERSAGRQLDLAGQNLTEVIHQAINARELSLIRLAAEPAKPGESYAQRLSPLLLWPDVAAVGHAATGRARVQWAGAKTTGLPGSILESLGSNPVVLGSTELTVHLVHDDLLVLAYPSEIESSRVWDLVAIDMVVAAENHVPEALADQLIWSIRSVPEGEVLRSSERLVHREYLILDEFVTWLIELRWTPAAVSDMGVGVDPAGAVVGIALSTLLALLASHLVHRRHAQVELEASRSLLEQKDLLLLALSHQIRTPLTAVIGFLGVALDEENVVPDRERRELLDLAKDQAQDAAEIVEDIVVAARINDENLVLIPKPIMVDPIIDAVFRATQRVDEVLELVEGESEAIVYADPLRIRQLIRNVFDEGRAGGARRWKVVTTPSENAVDIAFIANFEIPDRIPRKMLASEVASPKGLDAIQPHLTTATRLAEVMGGGITSVSVGGATAIHLLLPRTYFAADSAGRQTTNTTLSA